MRKCLYCYHELDDKQEGDYHPTCIKAFFGTTHAPALPYKLDDMENLAKDSAVLSISVPGVQPKLSLGWMKNGLNNGNLGRLTIMDALEGQFILKPQQINYPQMPENEHLSMKLAGLYGIDTVPSTLIRLESGEPCYISKRIDRNLDGSKRHIIDFMQILELTDKYKGSMETLGKAIGDLSVNTLMDKLRFFELAVFNYIIGNNDMHLKNFSMWQSDFGWMLSPAYDLLNVKLVLPKDKEEIALLLGGKKQHFNKAYFDRLGANLSLTEKQLNGYKRVSKWLPKAIELIDRSFLSVERQEAYKDLIVKRASLFLI
jgi:serine/threonine-protein kinase HipA